MEAMKMLISINSNLEMNGFQKQYSKTACNWRNNGGGKVSAKHHCSQALQQQTGAGHLYLPILIMMEKKIYSFRAVL